MRDKYQLKALLQELILAKGVGSRLVAVAGKEKEKKRKRARGRADGAWEIYHLWDIYLVSACTIGGCPMTPDI